MSFDSKKIEFGREHIDIIEIDLDYCSLFQGNAPCTAQAPSITGDGSCFNTFETCLDLPNYTGGQGGKVFGIRIDVDNTAKTFTRFDGGSFIGDGIESGSFVTTSGFSNSINNDVFEIDNLTDSTLTCEPSTILVDESTLLGVLTTKNELTFRFCTQRSPHPVNLDAIPSIISVSNSPGTIDIKGGLGVRSSLSVSFKDHPSSDIDIDKYLNERSWVAFERGTFWTKLRARNPNYQFKEIRHLSGYLEDGVYDQVNFQTRYYLIDRMDVSGGRATITAKDPLKLVSGNKAQAPRPSTGLLLAAITNTDTAATLTPLGVGNQEYAASGKILINKEVIAFTRSGDILTLTRAQNNTTATPHSLNDTIQQCLEYQGDPSGRIDEIVKDLLINFANVNPSFINASSWKAEADNNLSYLLDGIIVKPLDVNKILKELTQSSPHYLWWDERSRKIQFTALKAPPSGAQALDMESNIISGKFSTVDKPDMRVSTVYVNFGQFDPVEKIDEPGNFQQSYVRIDGESIVKYGSSEIEVINSRWLNINNKSGAIKLAELIGRRFANTPREVTFSLDAKDSDGSNGLWVGRNTAINHRDITDFSGAPRDMVVQITSARESNNYDFSGIEFNYGGIVGNDSPDNAEVVFFSVDELDVNLYDKFDSVYGTPDASTEALFIVELGAVIGSTSTSTPSMEMGDWSAIPAGFTITIQIDEGCFVVGKGGDGELPSAAAENGGLAINITESCTFINNGIIGGGGGGGASGSVPDLTGGFAIIKGGGGAGSVSGNDNGTLTTGGVPSFRGGGGNLGQDGTLFVGTGTRGLAGDAIHENGNTVTYETAGDIRGVIL